MSVSWQYVAISKAVVFIVSAALVARYSVIRFQSCAANGSVWLSTSWQFVTTSATGW
ncbi:hypothetical protein ABT236_35300 [Streptomyces sp. NPDC001523]|uniref:hypothetical protein n=1 Tax=Streptomyces sp. NPDC001523 TaxID=3154383 RepID=UPI0033310682